MNSRQMRQAMQKMGINQTEIEAVEVIIRTPDQELRFISPQVAAVNMMGQKTYQVIGEPIISDLESAPDINDDDIETVMSQTNVSREEAVKAIEDAEGDLAQAILDLQA